MGHSNGRKFTRSPSRLGVEVSSESAVVAGSLRDVSITGMYVTCENPFRETTLVSVSLILGAGSNQKIELRGQVLRTDPEGMAIQTEELGIQSYEHLKRLVFLNSEVPSEAEREFSNHLGLRAR